MTISRDTLSPGDTVALSWIAAREKIGANLTVLIIFSTVVLNAARGKKGGHSKSAAPIGNGWESGTAYSVRMNTSLFPNMPLSFGLFVRQGCFDKFPKKRMRFHGARFEFRMKLAAEKPGMIL